MIAYYTSNYQYIDYSKCKQIDITFILIKVDLIEAVGALSITLTEE